MTVMTDDDATVGPPHRHSPSHRPPPLVTAGPRSPLGPACAAARPGAHRLSSPLVVASPCGPARARGPTHDVACPRAPTGRAALRAGRLPLFSADRHHLRALLVSKMLYFWHRRCYSY